MHRRPGPHPLRKPFTLNSTVTKSALERESAIDYALTVVLLVAIVVLLLMVELAGRK